MTTTASLALRLPLPSSLAGQSILLIGGSSGIGFAAAQLLADLGAHITRAGRDADRLTAAAKQLGAGVQTVQADVSDAASLQALFGSIDQLDHVFVPTGALAGGPLASTDSATVRPMIDSRIWGAYADRLHRWAV